MRGLHHESQDVFLQERETTMGSISLEVPQQPAQTASHLATRVSGTQSHSGNQRGRGETIESIEWFGLEGSLKAHQSPTPIMSILNTNQAEFPTAFQLLTYRLTPLFSDRLIIYHFQLLNAFCFKTKKDKTKKAKLLCIFWQKQNTGCFTAFLGSRPTSESPAHLSPPFQRKRLK